MTFDSRPNLAFDCHQELHAKLIDVPGAKLLGRQSCSEVKRITACVLDGNLLQRAAVLA